VIIPELTVKVLKVGKPPTRKCVGRLKTEGAESMKTAVAGPVVLSVKPSISPVTVPGVFPVTLVKEKLKFSAWPGVDTSAIANANANEPKVLLFMAVTISETEAAAAATSMALTESLVN
jgi:hypothetical protein